MNKPLRIGAIVFSVKDISRTEKFYRDVLGLKTELRVDRYDADHPEEKMLIADVGGTPLIFFQRDDKPGKSPVVVFGLEKGIDDVMEDLAGKGAQIVQQVSEAPGGWSFDFTDPDQHMLSYYQSNKNPRRATA